MHGNVWEWCEDWLGDYPAEAVTDPKGPVKGTNRMLRGGAFTNNVSEARCSYRINNISPSSWHVNVGFRLARSVDVNTAIAPTIPKPDLGVVTRAVNVLVAPFTEIKAKEAQKAVAKSLIKEVEEKVDLGNGVSLDMLLIPAGKFKMGSPAAEPDQQSNEIQHEVALTNPFYLGKYEVSQDQWESVMGNNPSSKMKGAKFPVTDVSWNDCQEFIKKLNTKTNGNYRLPTEAEWEYACRAGTSTAYSFGENSKPMNANYNHFKVPQYPSVVLVGRYKPNAFGLYDMHGNVGEWCADWYGDYPAGEVTDPKGPATGSTRVWRGGSIIGQAAFIRSSFRFPFAAPNIQRGDLGLRLARTP